MVGSQRYTPAALLPGKRSVTSCIGGWVGPRDGVDLRGKSRPHWNSIPGPYSPSESLYRLRYPDPHTNVRIILSYISERYVGICKLDSVISGKPFVGALTITRAP